jgi:hypothetical protein
MLSSVFKVTDPQVVQDRDGVHFRLKLPKRKFILELIIHEEGGATII